MHGGVQSCGVDRVKINRGEMVDTRDVFRSIWAYLDRLKKGELNKVVIVRRGGVGGQTAEPVGVLLSPERYQELLDAASA